MKQRWHIGIGLILSLVAVAGMLLGIRWDDLGRELAQANYWWLFPFVLLETASIWARGMRWRVMLEEKIGSSRLFWITNISYYLNNVLPLRIGEIVRVYLATRDSSVSGMQAISTAVLERMIDVVTVFVLLLIVLPLVPQHEVLTAIAYWVGSAVLLGILGAFVIARRRRGFVVIVGKIAGRFMPTLRDTAMRASDEFLASLDILRGWRLGISLVWSLVVWLLAALAAYCILLGFLPGQPVYVGIFVTAIIALGIALPSVPAGLGLWEAATVAALAVFGVNREIALAYGLAMHLAVFTLMAIFGTIGLYLEGENLNHVASAAAKFMRGLRKDRQKVR